MIFPTCKYKTIYADPPWRFDSWSEKGEGRSAVRHYPVMKLEDMKTLPVAGAAAADCALLMWAIYPMLPEALELIAAWGFTFKTVAFTWAKLNRRGQGHFMGGGYWTRANAEICLLATRGAPQRKSKSVRQLIVSPVREHSRKPDEVYARIEGLAPGPYLELFARTTRSGWHSWGNQTGKFRRT